jgi:UDP-galactopyranose mutase
LPDLVCLSHLRWNFVFQRPQHLLSRLTASFRRVFFVEEPVETEGPAHLAVRTEPCGVTVAVPHLPPTHLHDPLVSQTTQRALLDELLAREEIAEFVLWYYTPMALAFSAHLEPRAVVYDCMDELSAFAGAPPELCARESLLLAGADLVFTGGRSLYESKRDKHPSVHCFPSSVDVAHFQKARHQGVEPGDQAVIPGPRIGFAGVIDERMDLPLLAGMAAARPDWHFVLLGPVVKIDPAHLPRTENIHYLGMKAYDELPRYMAGWDVAMMPFARNESTRFISPTKTPEYLAAGRPVVSTSIRDVVRPYAAKKLVHIADAPDAFVGAIELALSTDLEEHRARADRFLADLSWERTAAEMRALIEEVLASRLEDTSAVASDALSV